MIKWTLELTFRSSDGRAFTRAVQLDDHTAREYTTLESPQRARGPFGINQLGFNEVVRMIKVRTMRKDLFRQEAARLGSMLAEYLEDREGWHGEERAERIEQMEKENERR